MVISTPDIDDPLKPSFELIGMIGNIRGKIGGRSIRFHNDPVLIVAKGGAFKPKGPFIFVDQSFSFQGVDDLIDLTAFKERFLAEPAIVMGPEMLQVSLNPL